MPDASVRLNGRLIRAVIYDFGEVLSYPPPPTTINAMAELLHVTTEKFREYYYAERQDYDRGNLTAEQYWQAVARDAGAQLTPEQVEWLRRTDVAMWSNVNPQILNWAAQLRSRGMQTAVLSNMHADMARSVRAEFTWIRDFDCFVLSAELGFAKPEPQIFHHCLDCLKLPAGRRSSSMTRRATRAQPRSSEWRQSAPTRQSRSASSCKTQAGTGRCRNRANLGVSVALGAQTVLTSESPGDDIRFDIAG